MKALLARILKSLAYVGAALVILLAVAVGLFRLLLPRLPEYQDEIKSWANAAIGMQVQFADMDARWRLSGPELTFRDAELTPYDVSHSLVEAGEVSVGVSLLRLLRDREFVVDRIQIRESQLTVQRSANDGWLLQGLPLNQVIGSRDVAASQSGNVVVIASDIEVEYLLAHRSESVTLRIDSLEIERDDVRVNVDATVELPESVGRSVDLSATQRTSESELGLWQFFVEAKGLNLPGLAAVEPELLPQFQAGSLDVSASIERSAQGIDHATADFVVTDVVGGESNANAAIGAQGRIEYSRDPDGWLVAASNFILATVDGVWPRSAISVQVANAEDGSLLGLDVSASYLNLDDLAYLQEWIPQETNTLLNSYDPSGEVRDLDLAIMDVGRDSRRFDVAAELSGAGMAARDTIPGLRQFSGLLRANNSGGRLEIASDGLVLDLATQLSEPIAFDDASGTVIWRRNASGTTVLSDSIRVRNADLESNTSLQILLPGNDAAAEVDIQSNWSINDLAAVQRYLPAKLIKPKLYDWLSAALVAGQARNGILQLTGPLDKFPFDDGGGVFKAQADFENATLLYHPQWPAVENMMLDVVVEGMHLYSRENRSVNAGNSVVNADIDIPNLRRPELSIDAYATGTLESIRQFSRNSPIASVFGGHLDKVTVDGDASFGLQVYYPILDKEAYTYSARIQTNDGSLAFEGFQPALTELNGIVNVSREGVNSEAFFGRFLGEPVDIELRPADDTQAAYTVIAEVSGRLQDTGLFEELAPQMEGIISGGTGYTASIRFPKADYEPASVLQIAVESDLDGIQVMLPAPLTKAPADALPLSFVIEFPEPGHIDAMGSLSDKLNWAVSFLSDQNDEWDFDRGALAVGGSYPETPEIRGLHITGETDLIVLEDWLALARNRAGSTGIADRIRTIDLSVGLLQAIGQDIRDHRVTLQRSAQDWLVSMAGDEVDGTISVPYDFSSGRPMVIDMAKLVLPGRDEVDDTEEVDSPDPRNIPPLSVSAQEFTLGKRYFGELKAEFARTERGLESTTLSTRDASFNVDGSAGWVVNNAISGEQRTYLVATLVSSDIKATMDRLDYQPGIEGESMQIDLDLGWSGGPDRNFLERLSGAVALNLGAGTLDDVEPGAGRVFGLMSIVALPRRLSLDFKDVFEKGFGFDSITGSFRIEEGQAYTCDLSLEGPAADVGIVGRAGLVTRDYEQAAVVSANVGNTLPVIGAFVAGPQVAAALLVFSQIFKKPLQEVGQVYYGIEGSWDEPNVVNRNVASFAEVSSAAGCIDVTE